MTAQIENSEFYLIKTAALSCALILVNYIGWSLNWPSIYKIIPVILLLVIISLFLVRSPFLNCLPIKIFIASIALISLSTPTLGWDARSIWLFHAKRIFIENNIYAQLDGYLGWSHNDYPVLVPALSATLAKIIGRWNEVFPKFSSVLMFVPPILVLSSALKHNIQRLLFFNLLLFVLFKHFINGYMDGILAIYFTTASYLIYLLTKSGGVNDFNKEQRLWLYLLAVSVFSILTVIKNEGMVLFGVLVAAIVLTKMISRKTKLTPAIVIMFLMSLTPVIVWKTVCSQNNIGNDLSQSDLLMQLMGRVLIMDNYLKIFMALFFNLKFVLPLTLFIYVSRESYFRNETIFVYLSSLLYVGILFFVYLSTPAELVWHLKTSASRTISPIGLSLGFYALLFFQSRGNDGAV